MIILSQLINNINYIENLIELNILKSKKAKVILSFIIQKIYKEKNIRKTITLNRLAISFLVGLKDHDIDKKKFNTLYYLV